VLRPLEHDGDWTFVGDRPPSLLQCRNNRQSDRHPHQIGRDGIHVVDVARRRPLEGEVAVHRRLAVDSLTPSVHGDLDPARSKVPDRVFAPVEPCEQPRMP
jgi:hypothetical protein